MPPPRDNSSPTLMATHATLMVLSWGFLLPIGALVARYGKGDKRWFKVHVGCQILGITIASIGFLIAGTSLSSGGSQTHATLGPLIMIMGWFQPVNAYFRPHAPNAGEQPSRKRVLWNYLHWYTGRIALLLAVIQIFVGYTILQPRIGYEVLYDIVLFLLATALVVLEIRRFMKGEKDLAFAHATLVEDSQAPSDAPEVSADAVAMHAVSDAPSPPPTGGSSDGMMHRLSDDPPPNGSSDTPRGDSAAPAQAYDVAAV